MILYWPKVAQIVNVAGIEPVTTHWWQAPRRSLIENADYQSAMAGDNRSCQKNWVEDIGVEPMTS